MKKILLVVSVVLFSVYNSNAQTTEPVQNCYQKYAKVFEERGANDVEDGWHNEVIITYRMGSQAECYNGKCLVTKGKIESFFIKLDDGSFEKVEKKYRYDIQPEIINGISQTLITQQDMLINVMFTKKVKPKKKGYAKAAEPVFE